jgi:hypothetical protein
MEALPPTRTSLCVAPPPHRDTRDSQAVAPVTLCSPQTHSVVLVMNGDEQTGSVSNVHLEEGTWSWILWISFRGC